MKRWLSRLFRKRYPNAETIRAIYNVEHDIGITTYDGATEFFKSLEEDEDDYTTA